MKPSSLKTYSYRTTVFSNNQPTSPRGKNQAQGISRCNPERILCASCGSTPGEASVLSKAELAKFNNPGEITAFQMRG